MIEKFRGHEIYLSFGAYHYADTKLAVATVPRDECGHCGKGRTPEGYDGCIGEIAGAMNACCGHGNASEAYVQYEDGKDVRGVNALVLMGLTEQ